MSLVLEESFAGVWERTIQANQRDLAPDAARYFLELQFTEADRARMNELAAKARAGSLSEAKKRSWATLCSLAGFSIC
jgi:hypothetical protein